MLLIASTNYIEECIKILIYNICIFIRSTISDSCISTCKVSAQWNKCKDTSMLNFHFYICFLDYFIIQTRRRVVVRINNFQYSIVHYSCYTSRSKFEGNLISCHISFAIFYSLRLSISKSNRTICISMFITIYSNLITVSECHTLQSKSRFLLICELFIQNSEQRICRFYSNTGCIL